MRKKELEMALQKVHGFESPDPSLEQYMTPASMAADILFSAWSAGDVEGLKVIDLGCGTGMFTIGALLMGAGMAVGYDVSKEALAVARSNAELLGVSPEFVECDVHAVDDGADTVVMNPPFGCQTRNADRPFLEKAMEMSECVYSIHMANSVDFVLGFAERHGRTAKVCATYKYVIPHTFAFHSRTNKAVDVAVVNIR